MSDNFYVLRPAGLRFGSEFAYGEQVSPINTGDYAKCPVCSLPMERRKWLPPRRIRLSSSQASKWPDFLWGDGFTVAVSERFKKLYEDNNLKGISVFNELEVTTLGGKTAGEIACSLPKYYLVNVDWNGANLDDSCSQVIRDSKCYFCRAHGLKSLSKVSIEKSSWSGEDIFGVRGLPGEILTSEKFKSFVDEYELTGSCLVLSKHCSYNELSGMNCTTRR